MKIIYEELTSSVNSEVEKSLQVLIDQDITILLHDGMFYHSPGHRIRPGIVEGKLIGVRYYELDGTDSHPYKTMVHLMVTSNLLRSPNQWVSYCKLTDSIEDIRKLSSDEFKEVINKLLVNHHNSAITNYAPKNFQETVQLLK